VIVVGVVVIVVGTSADYCVPVNQPLIFYFPCENSETICREEFENRCTMNNYIGIGVDAQMAAVDFHHAKMRDDHLFDSNKGKQNQARATSWYGMLGSKPTAQVEQRRHLLHCVVNRRRSNYVYT
jgi:hypothetical protein